MFSSNTSAVSADANYIEDVFSTYLYTGNGSTQTITNGIDLAGKGGLVWLKRRSSVESHYLQDSSSSFANSLSSNTTAAAIVGSGVITAVSSTGFTTSSVSSGLTYASWTFRKQPKFFDVVTYSGSNSLQTINHNLGSAPGCIIIKKLDSTNGDRGWQVYHRSLTNPNTYYLELNTTAAEATVGASYIHNVTSTSFSLGGGYTAINRDNSTYVAYLFAHNAGGFGLTGTDNVITCGSFVGNGNTQEFSLGYEPQFMIIKNASSADNWVIGDTMRGADYRPSDWTRLLNANTSGAEYASGGWQPTPTGFRSWGVNGSTYIYIAIRRGPMKTPTTGTNVFSPITATDTEGQGTVKTTNFPIDLQITKSRASSGSNFVADRLRGISTNTTDSARVLITNNTDAETSGLTITRAWNNTGFQISGAIGNSSQVYWNFRRAPGFFDEVCYSGNSTAGRQVTHNLGVAPEFMIVKRRSGVDSWYCYAQPLGNTYDLLLDSTRAASNADDIWYSTSPTSTTFTLRQYDAINGTGQTYVAYLFASCPGVSKVGSYTGTGTTQQINCGFTAGARFVLIKRTDSTGDWYVWDSARGIVAGNDSYLLLNSTAAEVTSTDYIDTYSAGFEISSTAPAAINASGGTFLFLAVA